MKDILSAGKKPVEKRDLADVGGLPATSCETPEDPGPTGYGTQKRHIPRRQPGKHPRARRGHTCRAIGRRVENMDKIWIVSENSSDYPALAALANSLGASAQAVWIGNREGADTVSASSVEQVLWADVPEGACTRTAALPSWQPLGRAPPMRCSRQRASASRLLLPSWPPLPAHAS